jgi:TolB protein
MKTRNRTYAISFMLMAFAMLFSCQEDPYNLVEYGQIQGIVLDAKTSKPLIGVEVSTTPASSSVITNDKGEFTIPNIATGNVTVNAKKYNFKSSTVLANVLKNKITAVSIILEESIKTVGTIQIKSPVPDSAAINVKAKITLAWTSQRVAPIDIIKYDIVIYKDSSSSSTKRSDIVISHRNLEDTILTLNNLEFSTKYSWQVIAKYNNLEVARSSEWSFTTMKMPNPSIFFSRSSTNGLYDIIATDPTLSFEYNLTETFEPTAYGPVSYKNGNLVLFTSFKNNIPYIYGMRRDGTGIMQITSVPNISSNSVGYGYCFYDHGNKILFTSMSQLYSVRTDGTGLTLIATAPANRYYKTVDWCPETEKIVVLTVGLLPYQSEIYVMDNDGTNPQQIVNDVPGMLDSPSFSPDGKYIVYVKDASGYENLFGDMHEGHIILRDMATAAETDLTAADQNNNNTITGTNDLMPRFAPDSRQVIFMNRSNLETGDGTIIKTDIFNGGRITIVSKGTMPFWAI